ncbi:MAG: Heat shock protein [Burkholderiales bacterium]|nr:Heat shock protein [Burkholderiales bacterium]
MPSLAPLPATYVVSASCPGCLSVTLTLRPDAAFLSRERLGSSEFYDFGRWRLEGDVLQLAGGRDQRRYPISSLRRAPRVEPLRGPFRMVGFYDGATFKECLTGLAWRLADTRAAAVLKENLLKSNTPQALVALDALFGGSPEILRVFRPASILKRASCNG